MLCDKLRRFSYEEIEFFLPQLVHLVISIDNESMALEEFLLDLCEESVNGALLVRLVKIPEMGDSGKRWSQDVADNGIIPYRLFGFARPTFMTSPAHPIRTPSRLAGGFSTVYNGSSSAAASQSGASASPRMSSRSRSCQVWCLPQLECPYCRSMLVP